MMQEYIDAVYLWLQQNYDLITPKFITVLLIVFLGFVLGKIIEHAIRTLIRETPFERDLKSTLKLKRYPSEIIGAFAGLLIDFSIFVAVIMVLELTRLVFYSLLVAAGIVLVVFVVLNAKEFGPNTYAYYRLLTDHDVKEGKRMTLQGVSMRIKKLTPAQTTAVTTKGDVVTVHNTTVLRQIRSRERKRR